MTQVVFDPVLHRTWRLLEDVAGRIGTVHRLPARIARGGMASGDGTWDEVGAHQHAVPTVVGCLRGVVRLGWNGGHWDLAPGDAAVVAPAAWHVHERLRPGSLCWAQGLVVGGSDLFITDAERQWNLAIPQEPSAGLLHALVATEDPQARRSLLAELVQQCLEAEGRLSTTHPAVGRMADRMWRNLHRPLTAAEVLAASKLGTRQAQRLFTGYFGAGPKQVIRAQQLALAAELLREGMTVTETAAASGFPDRRAFTRAWRLAHGRPPSRRASER
jgi:AraC-like DNA-binding protein